MPNFAEGAKRQQVLTHVYNLISDMPSDHLARILTFAREIEDIARPGEYERNPLSKRETDVLTLIANGYNRKQVGLTLGISANTAARHIATIYTKLGVSSIAEATRYAIKNGIA